MTEPDLPVFDGTEFAEHDFSDDVEERIERDKAALAGAANPVEVDLEGDTIEDLAKSGVPHLMRRAFNLAMWSNDLKSVLSAMKEFADRGYGKVSDKVDLNMTLGVGAILQEIDGMTAGLPDMRGRDLSEYTMSVSRTAIDADIVGVEQDDVDDTL